MNKELFKNRKFDLSSGLVVFLVALPLSLGIASANCAPFFSGIIAGIVGGIVIASLSNFALSFGAGVWRKQKVALGYLNQKLFFDHNHSQ